jgi:Fe-S cluster assembly ATP-binding protein
VEIPGREQHLLPQGGAERHPQGTAARKSSTPVSTSCADEGEAEARAAGRQPAQAAGQLRLLGGEKKRNEIFQMAVLEPKLAILDETDSGLDIDALRIVADGVNALRARSAR